MLCTVPATTNAAGAKDIHDVLHNILHNQTLPPCEGAGQPDRKERRANFLSLTPHRAEVRAREMTMPQSMALAVLHGFWTCFSA